jgi:hypothetical protein
MFSKGVMHGQFGKAEQRQRLLKPSKSSELRIAAVVSLAFMAAKDKNRAI